MRGLTIMKIVASISVLTIVLLMFSLQRGALASDRSSVAAALDAGCQPLPAKLVVPSEMKAARLAGVLSSSWLPCGGGGHSERIGFRILSPTGTILAHVTQSFDRRDDPPEGDLMSLELGPGSYPVEISEGGPLTKVVVSFELIGAKQPTSGILTPGMKPVPKAEEKPKVPKRRAKGKKTPQ